MSNNVTSQPAAQAANHQQPAPVVPVLGRYVRGWPEVEADKPWRPDHDQAQPMAIAQALATRFDFDAHFAAYECGLAARLTTGVLAADKLSYLPGGAVRMVLFVVDVDAPNHEEPTPEWRAAERAKLDKLAEVSPGFVSYNTNGGYRLVWRLSAPIELTTAHEGRLWAALYRGWLAWLARETGIVGDPACADWTHLFRLPLVRRAGCDTHTTIRGDLTANAWDWTRGSDTVANDPVPALPVVIDEDDGEPGDPAIVDPLLDRIEATLSDAGLWGDGRQEYALAFFGWMLGKRWTRYELEQLVGRMPSKVDKYLSLLDRARPQSGPGRIRELLGGDANPRWRALDAAVNAHPNAIAINVEALAKLQAERRSAAEIGALAAAMQPAGPVAANDGPAAPGLPLADRGLQGRACKCDDIGNGERLMLRFGHGLRYVHARRKWLIWSAGEGRWRWDDGTTLDRLAQYTARQIHVEAAAALEGTDAAKGLGSWAVKSADVNKRQAMIKSAASYLAIDVSDLDRDPALLNCANGTLDLRSGHLRQHDPNDLITKSTGIAYDALARHELWDRVLHTATAGDPEMCGFLQRLAGYCTTGYTTEKHFFFLYSELHDTAKSTFCDALLGALGDYGMTADFGTWLEQATGGNRGDVVRLMGARLVVSVEVEENARFNAKLLKAWTGGDEITAAAKYEADVSFRPAGKIVLAANAAPRIRHADKPLFERCIRIPFNVQIPKAQQDKSIKLRLLKDPAVRSAVLAWMVAGCPAWQAHGLTPPAVVAECSRAYRAESDWLAAFLAERCELRADAETPRMGLRGAITQWFAERGLRPPSATNAELEKRLAEYGIALKTTQGVRTWRGVQVLRVD